VVIKSFQVAQGHQGTQVFVTLIVHNQQNQVVSVGAAIGRWGAIPSILRRHIDFAPDNGFDAGFGRPIKKIDHTEHIPMVGDGH